MTKNANAEKECKKMTGNEYQERANRTINNSLTLKEMESHALHGIVGEVGEIHSLYQKKYQGHEIDKEHLKSEVGDLLWFICEFCYSQQWKLEEVMKWNIDKLKKRYPEGFDTDRSLNREEGDR